MDFRPPSGRTAICLRRGMEWLERLARWHRLWLVARLLRVDRLLRAGRLGRLTCPLHGNRLRRRRRLPWLGRRRVSRVPAELLADIARAGRVDVDPRAHRGR